MGSWNETCSLTGLPIFECEEVYVVVIHKPQGLDNYPVSVAISGVYNDYGRIKFLGDAPLFVAYNQRRVEPLTYETLNPLFEERSTVYFLKEQTDEIIKFYVEDSLRSVYHHPLLDYEKFSEFLKTTLTSELGDSPEDSKIREFAERNSGKFPEFFEETVDQLFRLAPLERKLHFAEPVNRFLLKAAREYPERLDEVIAQIYPVFVLGRLFGELNKQWIPTPRGSQHEHPDLHKFIANAVIKKVDADEANRDW